MSSLVKCGERDSGRQKSPTQQPREFDNYGAYRPQTDDSVPTFVLCELLQSKKYL